MLRSSLFRNLILFFPRNLQFFFVSLFFDAFHQSLHLCILHLVFGFSFPIPPLPSQFLAPLSPILSSQEYTIFPLFVSHRMDPPFRSSFDSFCKEDGVVNRQSGRCPLPFAGERGAGQPFQGVPQELPQATAKCHAAHGVQ
jgi:hypothetical protein